MKLVAYVRQSVSNGGDSLDAQADAIRAWAKSEGHSIVSVFEDDGLSGQLGEDERPGLAAAIGEIEEGRADGLVVHRLDRLARALHVQEAVLGAIWARGGRVFAVDGGEVQKDDPEDPYRTFVRQVMGAAAQLERGMVRARMQAGRRRARAQGRHIGGDRPYGYSVAEDGSLVPIEEEQEVIRRIGSMRKQGATFRAIASELGWSLGKVQRAWRNRDLGA